MKLPELNTCYYIDCMDKEQGLPSLPDKSFDLCLTDPPYNIKFKGYCGYGGERKGVEYYQDNMSEVEHFININKVPENLSGKALS